MTANFEDVQKISKDNIDLATKSVGALNKGFQAIAVEVADYSKKSFEESSAHVEKLLGVKTLDKAIEIQTSFVKSSYETYVARMTKIGELYADLAKESYKPIETAISKAK